MDEALLQDFLEEAGELVDGLTPQLMALEDRPDDPDLLNAVFRSFHTIKGGAGFLALDPLVSLCHRAEDVFNLLRQGERSVTPELMDVMLPVADALGTMFQTLRGGETPMPADQSLLEVLDGQLQAPAGGAGDEDDLDALLDRMHRGGSADRVAATDPAAPDAPPAPAPEPATKPKPQSSPAAASPRRPDKSAPVESSLRVESGRLDQMMNLVGELVLLRNRLANQVERGGCSDEVADTVANLDVVTGDLQNSVMRVRMQAVGRVFSRFPRVVRDVARTLGKEVNLTIRGEDTEIDKNLVEQLGDPLVHLVRNAVDHGIEAPEARQRAGKPRTGEIVLEATREGHSVVLTIRDDGGGMDAQALRARAVEKGVLGAEAAAALSDREALELIFAPGFSTRAEVSDISGRGVGMDVVRTRINELRGVIEMDSSPGEGTHIRILLPLTLGIFRTLMVWVGGRRFALPLGEILEIIAADEPRVQWLEGRQVVVLRGEPVTLLPLGCLFDRRVAPTPNDDAMPAGSHMVIVTVGGRRVALLVDGLIGQEEVVVKPLTGALRRLATFAGATITGDGEIALIVDTNGLVQSFEHAA